MISDHLGRASVCPSPLTSVGTPPAPPPGGEGDLEVAALHPDGPGALRRRHRALDGLDLRRPTERRQLGAGPAGGHGGQLRQPARGLGEARWGVAVEDRQPPSTIRDRDGNVGIEAPGRRMAGSIAASRLVVASSTTWPRASRPSSRTRSWATSCV